MTAKEGTRSLNFCEGEWSGDFSWCFTSTEARWPITVLGTGTEWEGDDRVKARPRKPPEKDRFRFLINLFTAMMSLQNDL